MKKKSKYIEDFNPLNKICILLLSFSVTFLCIGCSKEQQQKNEDNCIVWWIDAQAVQEWNWVKDGSSLKDGEVIENEYTKEMNRMLKEKGFTSDVVFRYMEPSAIKLSDTENNQNPAHLYLEQVSKKFSVDIFTNYYANYEDMESLDSYIKENKIAKKFYTAMPASYWATQKVNHQIKYIPNIALYGYQQALILNKQKAYEFGVNDQHITNLTQMMEVLEKVHKEDDTVIPFSYTDIESTDFYKNEFIPLDLDLPADFRLQNKNGSWQIINLYMTPQFEETMQWVEKMNQKKLTGSHLTEDDYNQRMANGSFLSIGRYYPESIIGKSDLYADKLQIPWDNMQKVRMGGNGIYKDSKKKEQAVELLSLINTDKELSELFIYGLKGIDYEVRDGLVSALHEDVHLPTAISTRAPCGNYLLITPSIFMGENAAQNIKEYMKQIPITDIDSFEPTLTKEDREILNVYTTVDVAIPYFIDKDMKETIIKVQNTIKNNSVDRVKEHLQEQLDNYLEESK
ncbi:hypothetical protein MKC73_11700 [[Clostridium] innocuum]|nr:hypothetical protein [[Clostridium] innocuum]